MNKEIRALFPAASKYTYLNSAAVSPMPTITVEAVTKQLRDASENGTVNFADWLATKERARSLAAEMLKVRPEQIAFMRNTSDSLSSVANGLPWEFGDNIVSFANEFPANFYPWRRMRDVHNVDLRLCPEHNGRIDVEEFIDLIDKNTRVVAISAVQYASGFRADLERIGKAARAVDALFVVDIIQGFGALPFDLPAQYVDVAAGASHKWLCAPEGCGILFLSDRARERVEPTSVGWISVETPWDFADQEQPYKGSALAWESGTGAASLFYGLEQSLNLLHSTGVARIEAHLENLSDYLCEGLTGKDYEIVSSRSPGDKSQIVCIRSVKGETPSDMAERLQNEMIVVSPRGDRLRIAPHFYNNSADIERLLEFL